MTKAIKATTTKASINPFEALTKTTAKAKAPAAKKAVAAPKVKPQSGKVTKKSQAVTFYKKNIKKGKAAVIEFFKGDLFMTDAGANSYFYAIKKEVAQAAA